MKKMVLILALHGFSISAHEQLSTIRTPLLTLSYTTVSDRHDYQELVTSSDEVCNYLVGGKITAEELKQKYNSLLAKTYFLVDFAARNKIVFGKPVRGFRWKITQNETQEVIGYAAIKNQDSNFQHLLCGDYKSLSIFFSAEHQHKGYFKEVMENLLPAVFTYSSYKDADGIVGICAQDNKKMIQCLEKYASDLHGFSDTGTHLMHQGTTLVPQQTLFRIFTLSKSAILQLKSSQVTI
jgi:hypothetical protein